MASSSAGPHTKCGFKGCGNAANVSRCERVPQRCSACCDCGKHRPTRKEPDGINARRGHRNPEKELVREALNEHFVFLTHLEKLIDKRFSDWQWHQQEEENYGSLSFWDKHGLTTRLKKLEFCLTLAATSGVSASDIADPSRQRL